MTYYPEFADEAKEQLKNLKNSPGLKKRYKTVVKALDLLLNNPRHPGLQTHEFTSIKGPDNEKVFEAYAEQNTPAAYRIFFYYGNSYLIRIKYIKRDLT